MPFDWTKTKYTRTANGFPVGWVWTICPVCNQGRWGARSWAKKKPRYDGMCQACVNAGGLASTKFINGRRPTNDGYIIRHRITFTREELAIIEPMFKTGTNTKTYGGFGYIKEHRAVMALHIGRALSSKEIVHHINGNKSDNRLENLKLLAVKAHHTGHGDDYYQLWQEALAEIATLKAANAVLSSTPSI